MNMISEEDGSEQYLHALYDKNNEINELRRQLENQKLQILHYTKREFNNTKMTELSRTCRRENTEDNLPVVLEFAHFTKQNGMKSNILRLYEYMKHIDSKLHKDLNTQESIVKKISKELQKPEEQQITREQLTNQNDNLDLFNTFLEATVGLRQELHSFSICCNQLILIENERNNIVKQVISLPVEERFNCNILISLKQEILELKNIMKDIEEHREEKKGDLKKMNYLDEDLTELETQIKSSIGEVEDLSLVEDMVVNLQLETKKVLEANEKQQRKQQFQRTKPIVNLIKLAAVDGILDTNDEDQLIMFDAIKEEVHSLRSKFTKEHQLIKTELKCTQFELNTVLQERNKLKLVESELQDRIRMIQNSHNKEMASLKIERDDYKSQVDYLKTVKIAYDQLSSLMDSPKESELMENIEQLKKELSSMNVIIKKQEEHINLQDDLIDTLKNKENKIITKQMCKLQECNRENFKMTVSRGKLNQKTISPLPAPSSSSNVMKIINRMEQNILNDNQTNKTRNSLEIEKENKVENETEPVYRNPINKNDNNITSEPSSNIGFLMDNDKLHFS